MRAGKEPDGTPTLVKEGLDNFDQTAAEIIACKLAQSWPAPTSSVNPDDKTCDICDIRWNCPARKSKYPNVRTPVL